MTWYALRHALSSVGATLADSWNLPRQASSSETGRHFKCAADGMDRDESLVIGSKGLEILGSGIKSTALP